MIAATAIAPVSTPPYAHRAIELAFAPEPVFVGRCRRIATATLRLWEVPEPVAENVILIVSELVTNAVEHGGTETVIRVRLSENELRVEVTDGNPRPAVLHTPADDDESGRGLLLVALLTDRWGTSDGGTTTWCTILLEGET
ncbi:ATP-binding protein [Streptomyces sp. BH097]|uniref:ATP-binding protein n=1 Tax=unclassified Streptomyces TaxID=2593676 RepID=UPI003BB63165